MTLEHYDEEAAILTSLHKETCSLCRVDGTIESRTRHDPLNSTASYKNPCLTRQNPALQCCSIHLLPPFTLGRLQKDASVIRGTPRTLRAPVEA